MGLISRVSSRTYRFTKKHHPHKNKIMPIVNSEVTTWTLTECNKKLVEFRKNSIRNSQLISEISKRISNLDQNWSSIQDKHAALEQCVIAALDSDNISLAQRLFSLIERDFPTTSSGRAAKLNLLFYEKHDLENVLIEREELAKKAPTDQVLEKRYIADQIASGDNDKAILLLCEHLETFQTDEHSWMCLSDLYIQEALYEKAAFCLEELVMKNPHTAHYHIRLAEIYYTWATLEHGQSVQATITDLYQSG